MQIPIEFNRYDTMLQPPLDEVPVLWPRSPRRSSQSAPARVGRARRRPEGSAEAVLAGQGAAGDGQGRRGAQAQPKDPQARFLKGLLLTEQKKTAEAITVFTGPHRGLPELPEPYNNLAVLYASQGNYDKAKSALELAIHTHPSYATAHENLGDIYAQLASRAYDRALQLDKNNTAAQVKLAMVKDLFASPKPKTARRR
jgi:tetratricopeptide (TPR) repeat protein